MAIFRIVDDSIASPFPPRRISPVGEDQVLYPLQRDFRLYHRIEFGIDM